MSGTPPPPPGGTPPPPPPPPPGDGGSNAGGGGFTAGGGSVPPGGSSPGGSVDIGAAFRFGWAAFQANVGPILIGMIGLIVVGGIINFAWQGVAAGMLDTSSDALAVGGLFVLAIGNVFGFIIQVLVQAIIIRAGLDLVDGRELDLNRLIRTEGLGPILVAAVLVSLGTLVGFVLCIIPGIIFAFLSYFTLNFVVDDGMSATDAIRASIDLIRANVGSAVLLAIATFLAAVVGILLCGVGYFVTAPVAYIAQVHGYRQMRGGYAPAV